MTPGFNCIMGALKADNKRMAVAERQALKTTLEARRRARRDRIKKQEEAGAEEGALYSAGNF